MLIVWLAGILLLGMISLKNFWDAGNRGLKFEIPLLAHLSVITIMLAVLVG